MEYRYLKAGERRPEGYEWKYRDDRKYSCWQKGSLNSIITSFDSANGIYRIIKNKHSDEYWDGQVDVLFNMAMACKDYWSNISDSNLDNYDMALIDYEISCMAYLMEIL
jgi:hypothetical protein